MKEKTWFLSTRMHKIIYIIALVLVLAGQVNAQKKSKKMSHSENLQAQDYFSEGMKQDILNNYDKAVGFFERTLEIDPKNAASAYKLADIYAKTGNMAKAQIWANKAIDYQSEPNIFYYILAAGIYEKQADFKNALAIWQQAIKVKPQEPELYLMQANALLNLNKNKEALEVFDKFGKLFGENEDLIRNRQQLYLKLNKLDKAIEEGEKLIALYPENSAYKASLAQLMTTNGRQAQARKLLDQMISDNQADGFARIVLYEIYQTENKPEEAFEQLKMAFADPALPEEAKIELLASRLKTIDEPVAKAQANTLGNILTNTHPESAPAHTLFGDILQISDQKPQALSQYVKAVKIDGSKFAIWEQIIRLDLETMSLDSLLIHTSKASELFPNQAVVWFYNGVANMEVKNYKKAILAFEELNNLGAGVDKNMLLESNSQLGDAYHAVKNYEKSDQSYEKVLKQNPDYAYVLNNYSYYLSLRKEKLERALQMSSRLVELHPDLPTYLDTHAWVLYTMKKYKSALPFLAKAALDSTSAIIIEHYGDVLYQTGNIEEAVIQWKRAKKIGEGTTILLDKKIQFKKLYE